MAAKRDSSGRFVKGGGNRVTDIDHGYKKLLARMTELTKRPRGVYVGVRSKDGVEIEPGEELNLAQIAAVNEFGSEDGHVPERSYLRSTLDENQEKYEKMLIDASVAYVTGKRDLDTSLKVLGVIAVSDVQRKIVKLRAPPNAPATIARKGSSNPLIADGRLHASIDYKLRRIKK